IFAFWVWPYKRHYEYRIDVEKNKVFGQYLEVFHIAGLEELIPDTKF
ncbi:6237_t:CDS:1, partial [Dentiscutata erythropus]